MQGQPLKWPNEWPIEKFKNIFLLEFHPLRNGIGGEGGIRTPGPLTVNGFQDRRIRPLCHLSDGAKFTRFQPRCAASEVNSH
jgi:hypothetical protein